MATPYLTEEQVSIIQKALVEEVKDTLRILELSGPDYISISHLLEKLSWLEKLEKEI